MGRQHDINLRSNFLNMTLNHRQQKPELINSICMKWEGTCSTKNTMKRMKRQPTGQDKGFENHTSHKGLTPKMKKKLNLSNTEK